MIHEDQKSDKMKMRKKIILVIAIIISNIGYSQVIIGDDKGTSTEKTSVLLDFAAGQNKGLVLPYTQTLPSGMGLVEGTIVLDASEATKARVKYYNGKTSEGANGWVDLSGQDGDVSTDIVNQPVTNEDINAKAIIGASSSAADGVLVLESATQAMVLPQVTSTDDVPQPAPGMMVYINQSGAKRLAVFNGTKWSYWKPVS